MKIAIIGFGGMGAHHEGYSIKNFNESGYPERLEIAGIYDIDPKRVEFARSRGLHTYNSAEELLSDKEVDIVLVATPNDLHKPYVIAAARAGKHVISEKPIALSCEEAKEMYAEAKKAGVLFSVHQNRRWDCDFLTVCDIKNNNDIGEIYRVESRVMSSNGIPGAWRKVYAQGGGMMLDWGVHLIDQALLMFDKKVESVYCNYSYLRGEDVDDGFSLEIKFEGGIIYRIVVDTNTFVPLPRWQVYGVDGTAVINDWFLHGKVVSVKQRVDDKLEGIRAGNGFTKTMAARRADTVYENPIVPAYVDVNRYYTNFLDAVRNGEPLTVTEEQVMRVFKVMENAARSARENRVIDEII